MEATLTVTTLNDFVFCPYSIYLHQVYALHSTDLFHATPQQAGNNAHQTLDRQTYRRKANILTGLEVYSAKYNLVGKMDRYDADEGLLIERKRKIVRVYQGYLYQLFAQYFSMVEMGYPVRALALYSLADNRTFPVALPQEAETADFERHLERIRTFQPDAFVQENPAKCQACIYQNLCDKID